MSSALAAAGAAVIDDSSEFSCRKCRIRFQTKAQYGVHIAKFCVDSNLLASSSTPTSIKGVAASPVSSSMVGTRSTAATIPVSSMTSLNDVRQYLGDTRSTAAVVATAHGTTPGVGTLTDMRRQFQGTANELDAMKIDMMRRVEADRVTELQSLRTAAIAAANTRQQDNDLLVARTKQLEATRHRELRARIEQHRVNQVLQNLDKHELMLLEEEKKVQMEELAKERDILRQREDALQRQIEQMEHDLIHNNPIVRQREADEAQAAEDEKKARAALVVVTDERVVAAREQAQAYGARITELRLHKEELRQQREQLIHDMNQQHAGHGGNGGKLNDIRRRLARDAADEHAIIQAVDHDVQRSRHGITPVNGHALIAPATAAPVIPPLNVPRYGRDSPTVGVIVEPSSPIAIAHAVHPRTTQHAQQPPRSMVTSASAPTLPPRSTVINQQRSQQQEPPSPLPSQALMMDYGAPVPGSRRRSDANINTGSGSMVPVANPSPVASGAPHQHRPDSRQADVVATSITPVPRHGRRAGSSVGMNPSPSPQAPPTVTITDESPSLSPPLTTSSLPAARPVPTAGRRAATGTRVHSAHGGDTNSNEPPPGTSNGPQHHSAPGTSAGPIAASSANPAANARDQQIRSLVAELTALKDESSRSSLAVNHERAISRLEKQVAKLIATPATAASPAVNLLRVEDGWATNATASRHGDRDHQHDESSLPPPSASPAAATKGKLRPSKKEMAAQHRNDDHDDDPDSESHTTTKPKTSRAKGSATTAATNDEKTTAEQQQQQLAMQQQAGMYGGMYPGYGMNMFGMPGMGNNGMMGMGMNPMMGMMPGMGGMGGMGMMGMDPMWMQMQQQMWQAQSMIQQSKEENARLAQELQFMVLTKDRERIREQSGLERNLATLASAVAPKELIPAPTPAAAPVVAQTPAVPATPSAAPVPTGPVDETAALYARLKNLPPGSELYKMEMEHIMEITKLRNRKEMLDKESEFEKTKAELESKRRDAQIRQEVEEETRRKAVADAQAAAIAAAAAAAVAAAAPPPPPVVVTAPAPVVVEPAVTPVAVTAPPPVIDRPLSALIMPSLEVQQVVPPRPISPLLNNPYNAAQGFFFMWDFVTGIPNQCEHLQITYRLMKDGSSIPNYPAKSTPARPCAMVPPTPIGMQLARTMVRDAQKVCVVATKKQFPKIPVWPSLRLIMEIQRSAAPPSTSLGTATPAHPATGAGNRAQVQSLGWTVIDLFLPPTEQQLQYAPPNSDASRGTFNAGTWRVPVYRLPIDTNATQDDIGDNGVPIPGMMMYFRLATAYQGQRLLPGGDLSYTDGYAIPLPPAVPLPPPPPPMPVIVPAPVVAPPQPVIQAPPPQYHQLPSQVAVMQPVASHAMMNGAPMMLVAAPQQPQQRKKGRSANKNKNNNNSNNNYDEEEEEVVSDDSDFLSSSEEDDDDDDDDEDEKELEERRKRRAQKAARKAARDERRLQKQRAEIDRLKKEKKEQEVAAKQAAKQAKIAAAVAAATGKGSSNNGSGNGINDDMKIEEVEEEPMEEDDEIPSGPQPLPPRPRKSPDALLYDEAAGVGVMVHQFQQENFSTNPYTRVRISVIQHDSGEIDVLPPDTDDEKKEKELWRLEDQRITDEIKQKAAAMRDRMVDALGLRGDEGRGKLRKATGSCTQALYP